MVCASSDQANRAARGLRLRQPGDEDTRPYSKELLFCGISLVPVQWLGTENLCSKCTGARQACRNVREANCFL